ncbi:MAG: hypothetical protein ACYTHN_05680 [Planctomycetota bacterium]|jgi:hypothetical protein
MVQQRLIGILLAGLLCVMGIPRVLAGEGAQEEGLRQNPVSRFLPSRIRLDMKAASVTDILAEISRQAGGQKPNMREANDILLSAFKAEDEPFWPVVDRLAKMSQNVLTWENPG